MSWKGFKKAVNRMPHVIFSKAGYAEETADDEFNHFNEQLKELEQLSARLNDAAMKYKDALVSMLKHQESFGKVLLEVYEPITGRFQSTESLGGTASKKIRPNTPEKSMKRAQEYQRVCHETTESLVPVLDVMIERRVVQPTADYVNLHKRVQKTVVKRDHKRIDYDRHREALKKAKEKASDKDDERKIVKLENTAEVAYKEYENWNSMLKSQLPVYIQLRISFVDPILESLIFFQDTFFSDLSKHLKQLEIFVDMSTSPVEGYLEKKGTAQALIKNVKILQKRITVTEDASEDNAIETEEFDSDMQQPSKSTINPFVNTQSSATPVSQMPKPGIYPVIPSNGAPSVTKKPPPPVIKPKPSFSQPAPPPYSAKPFAVALYDFDPQQPGDLGFRQGDLIEILDRTEASNAWWKGRLNGKEGVFPGNYVQLK